MNFLYIILCMMFINIASCISEIKKINQLHINYFINNNLYYINKFNDDLIKTNQLKEYKISTKYFPAKSQNERIRFLILHYTALNYKKSISSLQKNNVSAHYLIPNDESDSIELLVAENKRAWHAGISTWKKNKNLNDISIGIEITNQGFIIQNNKKIFFDYTETQYKKIAELCKKIIIDYNIKANHILGHSDIAPQRKFDPGPKFPWKRLYTEYKIGAWYDDLEKKNILKKIKNIKFNFTDIVNAQKEFAKYGYHVNINGKMDNNFKNVIVAFQYHFRPEIVNGILDQETYAILLALNKKYK